MGSGASVRGQVMLVSGPPGSGKTTTAEALAAQTSHGVHIESDTFYRWIKSDFVVPHLPAAQAQNVAVMDVMADTAASYADAGYAVFVDGVIGPWFVERVARRLASRGVATHYLLLRPSRETALARIQEREQTNDTSGAAIMYDQFADVGEFESYVIDTDADRNEIVRECLARIDAGSVHLDVTDWIDR